MHHGSEKHDAPRTRSCRQFSLPSGCGLALLLMVHGTAASDFCENEELALFQRDLSLTQHSKDFRLEHAKEEEDSSAPAIASGPVRPYAASLLSVGSSTRARVRRVGRMMRTQVSFVAKCVIGTMIVLLICMACLLFSGRGTRQPVEDPRLPRSSIQQQKALLPSRPGPRQAQCFPPPTSTLQLFRAAGARQQRPVLDATPTPQESSMAPERSAIYSASEADPEIKEEQHWTPASVLSAVVRMRSMQSLAAEREARSVAAGRRVSFKKGSSLESNISYDPSSPWTSSIQKDSTTDQESFLAACEQTSGDEVIHFSATDLPLMKN